LVQDKDSSDVWILDSTVWIPNCKAIKSGIPDCWITLHGLKEHVNLTQLRFPVSRAHTEEVLIQVTYNGFVMRTMVTIKSIRRRQTTGRVIRRCCWTDAVWVRPWVG
jgi:hypothetical protein